LQRARARREFLFMKRISALLTLLALVLPMSAHAWWNGDWKYRKKIVVNTSPTGADVKEGVANALVSVRLHSGNFLFSDAKADGSDLRFVASDDKTPLKYFVEVFDATNQLALVWVQLPRVAAASSSDFFYLYSGNEKAPGGGDAKSAYDPQTLLALEFGEAQPPFKDTSAYGNAVSGDGVKPDPSGLFGGAGAFDGGGLKVAPQAATRVAAGGGLSFSAWVRPAQAQGAHLLSWGPLSVDIDGDQLVARVGREAVTGGKLAPGTWSHVAVTASDRLTLYVNGTQVGAAAATLPELTGEIAVGDGFHGSLDAVRVAAAARTPSWAQLEAIQGSDGKLLSYGESEAGEEGGSSYLKILFNSLTVDAKVVIAILAVMFAIAVAVMVNKAVLLRRTSGGNAQFLNGFTSRPLEFLDPESAIAKGFDQATLPHSSLARMYETGIRELRLRLQRRSGSLSAESVAAIKASIDATLIRENQRLNRLMVLLTIAISGGPFLGLLGTVVGVMITFASIAAAGDVNINAIAPGIAAALLATVAGLAVAIPSLFGYNYLITQIKAIAADMQAFSDEFICRMAEAHNG
jgi:biopolymer transport protein ExbB